MLEGFGNLCITVITPLPEERFVRIFKTFEISFPLRVWIHADDTIATVTANHLSPLLEVVDRKVCGSAVLLFIS
jgi:hypothetical protein